MPADAWVGDHHGEDLDDLEVELLGRPPAIGALIAKAAGRSALRRSGGSDPVLPRRRVMLTDQVIDVPRLADYAAVCGMTLRNEVPGTFLHVLSFPAQVHLMAAADFPFPMAGMVHVRNEMTVLRPVEVTELVTLSSWAEGLARHPRGATLDMVGEARVGEEVVWRGASTYLVCGASLGGSGAGDGPGSSSSQQEPAEPSATDGLQAGQLPQWAQWSCPGDLGRRYAAASGDVNPIHLNPVAAKAFGFRRTIAHGMWTHARALGALEGRLAARHTTSVEFRKPVLLPSRVAFRACVSAGGHTFAVTGLDGSREHMIGTVSAGQ